MAYGDSVVFHYNVQTGILEHSFTKLADFSNPPRLISCKDPLEEEGFRCGDFLYMIVRWCLLLVMPCHIIL